MSKSWKIAGETNPKVGKVAGVTGLEPAASGVTGQQEIAVFWDFSNIFTCIYRHLPTMTYIKIMENAGWIRRLQNNAMFSNLFVPKWMWLPGQWRVLSSVSPPLKAKEKCRSCQEI